MTEPALVTFTFFGRGNASLANLFQVNTGSGFTTVFTGGTTGQGSSVTAFVPTGAIPFRYVTGTGIQVNNGTTADPLSSPALFLAVDPYLASGQSQTSGTAAYIGLTDLPAPGDHDFQDLTVRVTVAAAPIPEPATLVTALTGLGGLACIGLVRRRPTGGGLAAAV